MTAPAMKWTIDDTGQWVRRCFYLTITPEGKSDKLIALASSRKDATDVRTSR